MDDEKYKNAVFTAARRNPRHPPDAYYFINDAVSYTVNKNAKENKNLVSHHVKGPELIKGVLEFAVMQYSFMAPEVFRYWDIKSGLDIGHIVFAMIRCGILSASKDDAIADFDCVKDIQAALEEIVKRILSIRSNIILYTS